MGYLLSLIDKKPDFAIFVYPQRMELAHEQGVS